MKKGLKNWILNMFYLPPKEIIKKSTKKIVYKKEVKGVKK